MGTAGSPLFSQVVMHGALQIRCALSCKRGQDDARRMRDKGGSDPTHIRAAESRTDGVAPARSASLGRVPFCASLCAYALVF